MPDDTLVTLRDYFERTCSYCTTAYAAQTQRLEDLFDGEIKHLTRLTEAHFKAIEDAVRLANSVMELRLDALNEFKATFKNFTAEYVPRDMFEARHAALEARVKVLEMTAANLTGRLAVIVGIVALGASVITAVITAIIIKVVIK